MRTTVLIKSCALIAILLFFSLKVQSQSDTTRLSCVGNSITWGSGLNQPSETYPTQLQVLLGSSWKVLNSGMWGRTILKKGDMPYWTTDEFHGVFPFKPNIITIALGTNDSKNQNWKTHSGEFKGDYLAMIDTFLTIDSHPAIWLCYPIPALDTTSGIRPDTIQYDIVPIIRQIAFERAYPLIDLFTLFTGQDGLYQGDGIHPTGEGAAFIASKFRSLLTRDTLEISADGNLLTAPDGYSWQWYLNDTALSAENGGTGHILRATKDGQYKVAVRLTKSLEDKLITHNIVTVSGVPSASSDTFEIKDNKPASTIVGQVTASDPDADPLTYKISSGDADTVFTINDSGEIIVNKPQLLKYNLTSKFSLVVTVSDGTNSVLADITINVLDASGVKLYDLSKLKVKIYPVPAKETLYISLSKAGHYTVSLYTCTGQLIKTHQFEDTSDISLDIHRYTRGIYLLVINNGEYLSRHKVVFN